MTIALGALAVTPALAPAATVSGTPEALPSCAAVENGYDGRERAQVTTLDDGGKLYTYEQNGQKIVLPQPPADFDPLKASDELLERYAFPPRPSAKQPDRLQRWEAKMASYTGMAPPVSCTGAPPPRTGIDTQVHHTGTEGSSNWSGYITSAPANKYQWNAAEADFFQVNGASRTSCKSNAILSSWVGLGGAHWEKQGYGGFLQAGTDAYTNGATAVWYEWFSSKYQGSAYFPEMYVYPGDYIGFLVEYSVATETATFVTYDQNTGVFRSVVMPSLPLPFYDGSSGDFIFERPPGFPLLNFGSTDFYYSEVRTAAGNWVWLGEANNVREQMWSGNKIGAGNLLATPWTLASISSFTDYYYACQ